MRYPPRPNHRRSAQAKQFDLTAGTGPDDGAGRTADNGNRTAVEPVSLLTEYTLCDTSTDCPLPINTKRRHGQGYASMLQRFRSFLLRLRNALS
jgi:hypothetical protein